MIIYFILKRKKPTSYFNLRVAPSVWIGIQQSHFVGLPVLLVLTRSIGRRDDAYAAQGSGYVHPNAIHFPCAALE